ncbi:class II fructose-bisphosphatase [Agaribacterium haliotis]|uniref:class II fructose-bisphosphatase n=1 Tax=Agaribacterium haliotis TaxID=2013869 RepID=UPI000BB57E2E|nr:class II fructose-bisphosphatase [Agaribacterium haliotis]
MNPDLALHFSRVTEEAALAAYKWLGRGDKHTADAAAVETMRLLLNQAHMQGEIVIGEGEIDDAPMLYIGEKLGLGGEAIDIAVDPIDGTRMTAMGQSGAVAVLAAADKGGLLAAPDMYMEKLCAGPSGRGVIDLNLDIVSNVKNVATAAGKALQDMTLITLAKPRHQAQIDALHSLGVRVFAIPDGDVAASLLCCFDQSDVDMMYCMGGAPEGVISAAAMRALGGDMQARLVPRTQAKGESDETRRIEQQERLRCEAMGVQIDSVLDLQSLVSTDQVVFSMTGITKGELVDGVQRNGDLASTETLVVSGASGTVRQIRSRHHLERKAREVQALVR